MGARSLNVVCGLWVFASAFLWPHASAEFVNAATCGLLITVNALLALGPMPAARYANTVIAIWLVISGLLLPRATVLTAWNHALFGMVVLLASSFPSRRDVGRLRIV
jgi:hypothetical protein